MKALKKLLAIVLTVCMLVGMPLSIDVSAIGGNQPVAFGLVQAMVIPDSWNTGLPSGKAISLYFTGNVKIDTDRVGAVVAILNQSHSNLVGAEGEVTHNTTEALCVWTAEIGELSTTGGNDYYVLLNGPKNKTVADIMNYCKNYNDSFVAVRLYDKMAGDPTNFGDGSSGADAGNINKDGKINGIVNMNDQASLSSSYYCHWNGHTWGDATSASSDNTRDAFDIEITTVEQKKNVTLDYAIYYPETASIKVGFSDTLRYHNAGNYHTPLMYRVVNENGEYMYFNGTDYKSESQVASLSGYTVIGSQLNSGGATEHLEHAIPQDQQHITYNLCDAAKAEYAACVAAAQSLGSGYTVALVFADRDGRALVNNGFSMHNYRIDDLWNGSNNLPLTATHHVNGGDRAIVPIRTVDELGNNSVSIESVSTINRDGLGDRVMVEFSEPIVSMNVNSYMRVYDATTGALLTHDPAAMTVGGSSNHLQWSVTGWTKADASGKYWIGTLNKNDGFAPTVNSYPEIVEYLGRIGGLSNYVIQMSLMDWEGNKVYGNHLVDSVVAVADSSKKLFANNTQDGGEDRSVCSLSESLQITDIQIYANTYVVMTFSHDVNIDGIVDAINNNKVDAFLTAQADMVDGWSNDPIQDGESHIHQELHNAQRFGNATDKVLFSGIDWASFKARCAALTGDFDIAVRFEGGGNDGATSHVLPGFTAVDSDVLPLYRTNPNPDNWGGRHWITSEELDAVWVKVEESYIVDETTVRVRFNTAVSLDMNGVELWMTRYQPNGGTPTFDTGAKLWQKRVDNSTIHAVDANGQADADGISEYWQFTMNKQDIRDAVNSMNSGNFMMQNAVEDRIGFRFELQTVNREMIPYFPEIMAEDGERVLKSNSEASYRYFFPLDTTNVPFEATPVTLLSAKMIDDLSLEIKFSAPVKYTDGLVVIQVTTPENRNYANAEIGDTMVAQNPNADGYTDTWHLKLTEKNMTWFRDMDQIDGFADRYFNNDFDWRTADRRLTLGVYDVNDIGDGLISGVMDEAGNRLLASTYVDNPSYAGPESRQAPAAIVDISNDPFFEMETSVITAEQVNDGTHFLINTPTMVKFDAPKQIRVYNGSTLVKIDGRDAVWTVGGTFNLSVLNNEFSGYLIPDFGCYSIADIEELLYRENITYTTIGLALVDTTFPGDGKVCKVSGRQGANNDIKQLKTTPDYCSATEDVALIELVDNGKEMVVVTDISIYEDPLSPYGDKNVIVTFSHDIDIAKLLAARPEFWLTITGVDQVNGWAPAANGDPIAQVQISSDSLQRYGNSNNKIVGGISGGGYGNMMAQVAQLGADYTVKLRIEGAVGTGAEGSRVADNINALDSNVLSTLKTDVWSATNGRVWMNKTINAGSYFVIDSAEITDKSTVTVRFEDPAGNPVQVYNNVFSNDKHGFVSIRITNAQGSLLNWINIDNGNPTQTLHLQFTGDFAPTADRSAWTFTLHDKSIDLYDVYAAAVAEAEIAKLTDYRVNFAIEREGNGMVRYIDNLTTVDGKGVLYNNTTTTESYRAYVDLTLPMGCTESDQAVTILSDSYQMLNENQFSFTFSEAVTIDTAKMYIGLRLIDSQDRLIFKAADATPAQYRLADGVHTIYEWTKTNIDGDRIGNSPMQWDGYLTDSGDGKTWIFTMTGKTNGVANLVDLMQLFESTYKAAGYRLEMALQENSGVSRDGVIATVASVATGRKLINNASQEHGTVNLYRVEIAPDTYEDLTGYTGLSADGHYLPIEIATGYQRELTMDKVEQLSKNELLVTFSEAVTIDTVMPFMCLRMVDAEDRLIWANRDATGTKASLGEVAGANNTAMQWSSTGWKYANDDPTSADYHKQIIVSFGETMDLAKLIDKDNFPEALKGYEIKFGIEEKDPQFDANNRVQGVTGMNGQQLTATMKLGAWDGAYCAIDPTSILTPDTVITVSDAKISAENQVTYKFSHSVNLGVGGTYTAFFRYVDQNGVLYGNEADGHMQIGAYLNYTDETHTTMTAHLIPDTKWGVYDMDDILNPTGALKEYMDAHPGKWMLCLEETNNAHPAIIDSFSGKDGHVIEAKPMIAGWNDGLYLDITGTPITGELDVTGVEIISDTQIKVIFSAPIVYKQVDGKDSTPFVSMRLFNASQKLLFWNPYTEEYTTVEAMHDKDGNRIYENQNGYTVESEGYNDKGEWVPYRAMNNQAMQWVGTPQWGDDAHTTIIYTLSGGAQLPIQNLTDILNYDFSSFGEGAFLGFDIEENTPGMIASSGHVENILRADNTAIALDANFFPHGRDSVMFTLDAIKVAYKPYKITSKTEIINDMQIRVSFSEPVVIESSPFMAIRMIDKNGNLMWSGKENLSTPYQWSGSWEWENESHTSLIWTMYSGIMGGKTIYELANWVGVLQKYKNEGTWMFVIEELDDAKKGFTVGRFNNLVDNVTSKDGTVHLQSTYSKGLDGVLTRLNVEDLIGPEVELLSAQALDDQTIRLTFTEAVNIDEAVSMGVRYLTASGDSEVLTDGKTAYFKGDWTYADDSKKVIIWTLNSKNAENLTDIINYNGRLQWNKGARVAFVIMDEEGNRALPSTMRINGIYDLTNGFRRLKANYTTEKYPMTQMDIEVLYDIPAPEVSGDDVGNVIFITNYIPFIVASAVIALAGLAVAIILYKKRKKNQ